MPTGSYAKAALPPLGRLPTGCGARIRWTGSNYRFRDVARIKATEAACKRFIADTRRRTGIQGYFARGTVEEEGADEA